MKRLNLVLTAIIVCALTTRSFAQQPKPMKALPTKPLNVAFVVYKDMEALDFSGPLDVFIKTERTAPHSYNIYTVGTAAGPINGESGVLTIQPRYTILNCPRPDILVVPGAPMSGIRTLQANRPFMQWLTQMSGESRLVMSVCTGAFLLGKAELLNGRKSTTHWFVLDDFQREFPKTTAMQGVRFVEDGKFVTTAGISSGIDGALHVVEKTKSKQIADGVARTMQYRRDTPAYPEQPRGQVVLDTAPSNSAQPKSAQKLASKVDPVCGMTVDADTKFTSEYHGHLYGFCSEQCRKTFVAHPAQYVK